MYQRVATRSAMSSRQGAAMICTLTGIGSINRDGRHRQPDERDRLGMDADIGAHR